MAVALARQEIQAEGAQASFTRLASEKVLMQDRSTQIGRAELRAARAESRELYWAWDFQPLCKHADADRTDVYVAGL